ncbi:pyrimidine-nucleoside phosphorylase [Mycoplasmopsis pullorum]|uniref:Pyrimidine-nucleoside phosphorylase n=1 Tax=Mycoplasmopsis pullorum TaxID=48003 RepID=A0A1L4FRM2_9BACT|nr:pyrimidine-nucleoside phosphorylase [Mycoplasmopsis pullorum]APJ38267.1 pyrimidine-nucleoside phosphorylase [Mycoplasmopsis pullorum]TNK82488.1 pyrimidine-nucleoside phosphorylase [Mycoplasmopsis pullorum]TNK83273.1 pyrimidine-nucleoside phosphorylase [Mycoplasmopsis pullorum]TNK84976.1 pyrimidine-nucleoside phosphorylase [Mycoplasmopsis pullorum]TNK85555.1 pyrimidine-nucleoside phosphorylase [Mycoplasmopsis pullorum]
MRVVDIIEKKRLNHSLDEQEIKFLLDTYVTGQTPDYQMSAFLMAVMFNGMNSFEIAKFTEIMMHSGDVMDLSEIPGIKVDKHSTGGVGDKTTLSVAPIVAACGAPVAKMSGRGLGHTGGTIDKLESIPGFTVELSEEEFIKQVKEHEIAVVGQSSQLVPADKKIYALRDVTSTVESIPLIASSIMSKKLATGSNAILLDVKCGNGAFMKDLESAKKLAQTMINIGKELNVDVRAEITNMSRPIGREIGNKNEVLEAIATLKGEGPADFTELVYSSCATILEQAKLVKSHDEGLQKVKEVIENGKALEKFYEFVQLQKGDVEQLKDKNFWHPEYSVEVKAHEDGFLEIFDALTFGIVAMKLGAGRATKEDSIDNEAGITLVKKTNEPVQKGDTIFKLYSSKPIDLELIDELKNGYKINKEKVENKIILAKLK